MSTDATAPHTTHATHVFVPFAFTSPRVVSTAVQRLPRVMSCNIFTSRFERSNVSHGLT